MSAPPAPPTESGSPVKPSNFLRQIIEADVAQGTHSQRRWSGAPADAATHQKGGIDTAVVRTRFPPEPNGYLHIGHAKSICLNFGLAQEYGGICHLRFDDTNPEKEEQAFVDSILASVKWLGFDWVSPLGSHLFHASDYFGFMYRAAEFLVEQGLAYVDEQSADAMRVARGDFNTLGTDSPFRNRSATENLARLRDMKNGELADGAAVLRAKIDMASPNMNMRDPAIYRIRRATHHNTGDTWCIYPMYTYAHPIEDALENITHSICTLEFEDQRPFYDWLLGHLAVGGLINTPPPRQYEFARLNTTYVITSKRKLKQLVDDQHVAGWDDPRMPTLEGLRRRGYTPSSVRSFIDATGVTKSGGWVDYAQLEQALRDDLDPHVPRAMAVLDPIKLVITNFPENCTTDHSAPVHPQHPESGTRQFKFGKELWIERDDFQAVPEKGYHRLYPPQAMPDGSAAAGSQVRLKYGYVVKCTGYELDPQGQVSLVRAEYLEGSKSGTPTSGNFKAKGVITWVHCEGAQQAEVRLYDRLFTQAQPDAGGKDFLSALNDASLKTVRAFVEPSLSNAKAEQHFQFERHGYFVADRIDHAADHLVFNKITGLKDSWSK